MLRRSFGNWRLTSSSVTDELIVANCLNACAANEYLRQQFLFLLSVSSHRPVLSLSSLRTGNNGKTRIHRGCHPLVQVWRKHTERFGDWKTTNRHFPYGRKGTLKDLNSAPASTAP